MDQMNYYNEFAQRQPGMGLRRRDGRAEPAGRDDGEIELMNDVLKQIPAGMRKEALRKEKVWRRKGIWGGWERLNGPFSDSRGWFGQVHTAHRNKVFCVLQRETPSATHLAVSSLSGIRPTWHEMQRIKNEIAGASCTAVEVYPPQDEVVDGADMFHIWVLPAPLPFSIFNTAWGD